MQLKRPTTDITAEHFTARVGSAPENDDLARSNCIFAGIAGHESCGWCEEHDQPVFCCIPCMEARAKKQGARS